MTSEQLFYDKKTGFDRLTDEDKQGIQTYAEGYKKFLDESKTERDAVLEIARMAESKGFRAWTRDDTLRPGDKIYRINRHKGIMLAVIGEKSLAEGVRLTAAHLDAPRVDIRTVPLYEDNGMAFFKTHYYGGIKKYQWTTIPLELRGVVCVCDKGEVKRVEVRVGDKPGDPKFVITDLLPHLAANQMSRKATEIVKGEGLNILVGSVPSETVDEKCSEKIKLAVMEHLNREYGMTEADFLSAELEVVPAGKAREAGLDRSMVLGYGQDDRVCAFTSLAAMLEIGQTERTACCILVDKEEIGSVGATGMQSRFFENTVAEVLNLVGEYSELNVRRCLAASDMLSSDVSAAFDPSYASAFEKKNAAFFGRGMVFNKFTGARGKSGSNDANAEYVAHIRAIMEESGVAFQTAELGKIDVGGGGTIAYILALYGMNVIDCGVAVLSMHAPWEATSKADIYETKCGYVAFLEKACL